jgi:ankyrin repeat protein
MNNKERKLFTAIEKNNLQAVGKAIVDGADPNVLKRGGGTPLLAAITSGADVSIVKLLLAKGARVFHTDEDKHAPLREAVSKNRTDIVEALLEAGADADCSYGFQHTPVLKRALYLAFCLFKNTEMMRILIKHGAKTGAERILFDAAANGDTEIVKFISEEMCLPPDTGYYNKNPLRVAIKTGNTETAKYLLDRAMSVDGWLKTSSTELFGDAISCGDSIDMFEMLFSFGQYPDKNDPGYTYLGFRALSNCNDECFKFLFPEWFDPNIREHGGANAPILQRAIMGWSNIERTKHLIKCGADPNMRDGNGKTALFHVVGMLSSKFTEAQLLLDAGVDINEQDMLGMTILMKTGGKYAVEFLLSHGADIELQDIHGKTALFHAAEGQKRKVFQSLLEAGARVDTPDIHGKTVAHAVIDTCCSMAERSRFRDFDSWLGVLSEVIFKDSRTITDMNRIKKCLDRSVPLYVKGVIAIVISAAILPESSLVLAELMSGSMANSFKYLLGMDSLPSPITPNMLLTVASGEKSGSLSLDRKQTKRLVSLLLETMETNPGVVLEFIRKRVGKKVETWVKDGVEGADILVSRLAHRMRQEEFVSDDAGMPDLNLF